MPDVITNHLDIWTSPIIKKSNVGRGSKGKQTAYGIKKLRELILELAVRGKLVPQNSDDEPASVLLEKIRPKKEQIIKRGKFKKLDDDSQIDNTPLFTIPKNWSWCRLNDLAAIARGGSPRPIKSFITDSPEGLNWIKIGDSDRKSRYINSTEEKIKREGLRKTRVVYPGDLILSNSMSYGFPYILKIQGCIHDGWLVIRSPESLLDKLYMCYLFLSPHAKKSFDRVAAGAVVQNLNADKVRMLTVPLPPLAEQHRIVAKVDELMALCDQLEQQQSDSNTAHQCLVETLLGTLTRVESREVFATAWQRIAKHFDTLFTTADSIDQLKQTLLQLAVMGKLVPQDPKDEPASVLLEKIAKEKARLVKEGKIKKQKPLPEISDQEKPFELPVRWEWVHIWDVAKIITSGSRDWAKYYSESGAIFVTMGNLSRGYYKLRMDSIRYVNPVSNGEGARTKLEEHDLLISITGDVGNLGLIPQGFGEAYINQHTCLLRFMPDCQSRYFPELMRSPWAKFQFDAPQRGIKNSFRLSDVGEMLIPFPPLPEQHRIVAKVDELMTLCDVLKTRLNDAQNTQVKLADAIVKQSVG